MRIKVLYKSGIENSYKANGYDKAYFVEVESEDTCMMTLFMEKGSSTVVCFDEHYPYPYNWTTLGRLPYCQKDGQYYWDIDLNEISIRDFINTHDLSAGEPINKH